MRKKIRLRLKTSGELIIWRGKRMGWRFYGFFRGGKLVDVPRTYW